MTVVKPEWVPIWVACKVCLHKWDDWQPNGVRVEVWVATVNSLRCPMCGAGPKEIVMRQTVLDTDAS